MSTSLEVLNITGEASAELGHGAAASGDNAIAIGAVQGDPTLGTVVDGNFATGDESIAIGGKNAEATANGAVQLGAGTNAHTNTLQFQEQQVPLQTRWDLMIAYTVADRLMKAGDLSLDGADTDQWETDAAIYFRINGVQYTAAANTGQAFTAGHIVTTLLYGVVLVQVDAAGTMTTKVPLATQAYATAVLALAALPDPDANQVAVGYIAIHNGSGSAWTANTDALDAANITATFVDTTLAVAPTVLD